MRKNSSSVRVLCLQVSSLKAAKVFCRGLALGTCGVLVACGPNGLGPWQEEVKLADGRVIVVERFEESEIRGPLGDAKDSYINTTTIKFIAPPDLAVLPVLAMPYRPILLDYDSELGTWFAVGVNERMCWPGGVENAHMNATGRINIHPNFEYRLLDGKWQEVEMSQERVGQLANLLIVRTTVNEWMKARQPLPLAEKRRVDGNPRLPVEYRKVVSRVGCG